MEDEAGLLSIVVTVTKTIGKWALVLTGVSAIFDSDDTTYEEDETDALGLVSVLPLTDK